MGKQAAPSTTDIARLGWKGGTGKSGLVNARVGDAVGGGGVRPGDGEVRHPTTSQRLHVLRGGRAGRQFALDL